jgi:predicted phosphodiesterase
MMAEMTGIPEELEKGRSIIVVSDLHLGGGDDRCTSIRFSRFLDTLATFGRDGPCKDLMPPKKIILLGDFLDLWDPYEQNRNNSLIDAMVPLVKAAQTDCEIIYVTGNHDEDISELKECLEKKPDVKNSTLNLGNAQFRIFEKSYIPNGRLGIKVGDAYYAFLHGHQFDGQQITQTVSECLKIRWDPVDYLEDLANVSTARQIPPGANWVLFITWIFLILAFFWYGDSAFIPITGYVFGGVAACCLLYGALLFGITFRTKPLTNIIAGVCLLPVIILLGLIYTSHADTGTGRNLFLLFLAIMTYIIAVISFPRIIACGKRWVYDTFEHLSFSEYDIKTFTGGKGGELRDVRSKKTRGSFRPEEYTDADVVVFGHTHCAGYAHYTIPVDPAITIQPEKTGKYFLFNTGAWLDTKKKETNLPSGIVEEVKLFLNDLYDRLRRKLAPHGYLPSSSCMMYDTLLYLDCNHAWLMRWDDDSERKGILRCGTRVSTEAILKITRKNFVSRSPHSDEKTTP